MTTSKRGRGRPRGSGLPDGHRLDKVADLMIARPGLKHTTAIKQTNPAPSETEVRRLQIKWNAEGEARLQAARDRQAAARAARSQRSESRRSGSGSGHGGIAELERRMQAAQRLMAFATGTEPLTALDRAARGLERTTQMDRLAAGGRLMDQIDAIENSPVMKAARALEETPTMRLVRAMENSPTLKLAREMDRWKRLGLWP